MANKTTEENMEVQNVFEFPYGYIDKETGNVIKEFEIREMTGMDEEEIAKTEVRSNIGKIVSTILANCIVRIGTLEKKSTPFVKWESMMKELFLGDRDYALQKITEATHGKELSFPYRCPHCGKEMEIIYVSDELGTKAPPADPNNIPFTLPKGYRKANGEIVKEGYMRMPNGFDQEQLDVQARKNPGVANTLLITRCVKELGNVPLSSNTFRELSIKDRDYLINLLSENTYGVEYKVDVICDTCGREFSAGVNPANFIF